MHSLWHSEDVRLHLQIGPSSLRTFKNIYKPAWIPELAQDWINAQVNNLTQQLTHSIWILNQVLFHHNKWEWIQQFKTNEKLSKDQLNDLIWSKQKALLAHAFENAPFYKKIYTAAGLHPQDIRHPDDFTTIPILTKEMIRENLEQMVACGGERSRLRESRTGGSTGKPLKVYRDAKNSEMHSAVRARALRWWGLSATAKTISVWRVPDFSKTMVRDNKRGGLKSIFSRIPLTFNAMTMNEQAMEEYVRCLNETRPVILMGYMGAIDALAEYIEKRQCTLVANIKAVWTTSAPLGVHQEKRMERVFGAPVYDQYGSCEVHYLAIECRAKEGLHALTDIRHIECIDDQGKPTEPNVAGDIVVTDLENYAAPLIRYRIGDRGSYKEKKCSCGNILPLMNRVTGRVTDMIILPDGGKIAGDYFTTPFDPYVEEVGKFQVHQRAKNRICIKVIMRKPAAFNSIKTKLTTDFTALTRGLVDFHFEQVNHIEHDHGKYRYVTSDVR